MSNLSGKQGDIGKTMSMVHVGVDTSASSIDGLADVGIMASSFLTVDLQNAG